MMFQRILIIGNGGAGKSTLAASLGRKLGIEVVHLDSHFWRPGWIETEKEQWRTVVLGLLQKPSWVMDGNFGDSLDIRMQAADTIIFLDFSPLVCLWRILMPRLKAAAFMARLGMTQGCPERFNWEFTKWVWGYPRTCRPIVLKKIQENGVGKVIHVFKTPRELQLFVDRVATPLSD